MERAWISGWDFTVLFDDALVGGLKAELEDHYANLAASVSVIAVLRDDKQVCHLRVEDLKSIEVTEKVGEVVEHAGSA